MRQVPLALGLAPDVVRLHWYHGCLEFLLPESDGPGEGDRLVGADLGAAADLFQLALIAGLRRRPDLQEADMDVRTDRGHRAETPLVSSHLPSRSWRWASEHPSVWATIP